MIAIVIYNLLVTVKTHDNIQYIFFQRSKDLKRKEKNRIYEIDNYLLVNLSAGRKSGKLKMNSFADSFKDFENFFIFSHRNKVITVESR